MKKVNDNVKEFRELMKLDQEAFADRTGIDIKRLIRIEDGKADLTIKEVVHICDEFGVCSDYIVGAVGMPYPTINNEKEAQMWHTLLSLPPEDKEKVLQEITELS